MEKIDEEEIAPVKAEIGLHHSEIDFSQLKAIKSERIGHFEVMRPDYQIIFAF